MSIIESSALQKKLITALAQRSGADISELHRTALHTLRGRLGIPRPDTLGDGVSGKDVEQHAEGALSFNPRSSLSTYALWSDPMRAAQWLLRFSTERYSEASHIERPAHTIVFDASKASLLDDLHNPHSALRMGMSKVLHHEFEVLRAERSVHVLAGEPLAREALCRFFRRLGNTKKSTALSGDAADMLNTVHDEVRREADNAAHKAMRLLKLSALPPDLLKLVGYLKFRLSHQQNQWRHSIETAALCGLLAAELGLDVTLARRAGLLHDIGKVLTHHEAGGHAVLGAARARSAGESEMVCNAIGAHHFDEVPNSAYAQLVITADALSGARPGARREADAEHGDRMARISAIAKRVGGNALSKIDVGQSGRDIRVYVGHQKVEAIADTALLLPRLTDTQLQSLARDIAHAIQEEVMIPGQFRLAVIAETTATTLF